MPFFHRSNKTPSVCAGKDGWKFDPVFFEPEKLPTNVKRVLFSHLFLMVQGGKALYPLHACHLFALRYGERGCGRAGHAVRCLMDEELLLREGIVFKVSVKGVIADKGRYLLRVNERDEYELLGGKLEHVDKTLADRVRQELLEESGVVVDPKEVLEPWFYVIGGRPVLIVPMRCEVVNVPPRLFDQDGGRLEWVASDRLGSIGLPASYADTIRGARPRLMELDVNAGPRYEDDQFNVELVIVDKGTAKRHVVDSACDFCDALHALGCEGAEFLSAYLFEDTTVRVVFAAKSR